MEHGSTDGAPTQTRHGDNRGVLQGSGKEDAKHVIGRKKLDAHDQKTMDKLYGACDAREQRTYDVGSDVMAELRRTAEAERGRKAGGTGKRTNNIVGWGIGKNQRSSRNTRGS